MTSSVEYAVDTSVAIAALDASHVAHMECRRAVQRHRPVLAGHAAFEAYSMLTRMPGVLAVDPRDASDLLLEVLPETKWLTPTQTQRLRQRLAALGVTGGGVYDALVGEAARVHGRRLLTRDARARRTYDLVGVDWELVGP
jgi:predicted nucleic acid-binding protein